MFRSVMHKCNLLYLILLLKAIGNERHIAITGAVLIKENFALAHANDVVRIPSSAYKNGIAMFIPSNGKPWKCKLDSHMVHPEFEFVSHNTLALVKFTWPENEVNPVRHICCPLYNFNASNELYAVGFTDENELLEKIVFKMQYIEKTVCQEYYKRIKFRSQEPDQYQCSFAINSKKECQWENGMALVSNSTGKWILIGLSTRGPGCFSPARFIEILPYLPWIKSVITADEDNNVYY